MHWVEYIDQPEAVGSSFDLKYVQMDHQEIDPILLSIYPCCPSSTRTNEYIMSINNVCTTFDEIENAVPQTPAAPRLCRANSWLAMKLTRWICNLRPPKKLVACWSLAQCVFLNGICMEIFRSIVPHSTDYHYQPEELSISWYLIFYSLYTRTVSMPNAYLCPSVFPVCLHVCVCVELLLAQVS